MPQARPERIPKGEVKERRKRQKFDEEFDPPDLDHLKYPHAGEFGLRDEEFNEAGQENGEVEE